MQIQSNLGSTIAMAFDECIANPAEYNYTKQSCERTYRWLERCKTELARLNALPDTVNPRQMLFGINQGSTYEDLRIDHMKKIASLDCDGYAIGGLAVGESAEEMYRIISAVEPYMPENKPRYLMGVGTPQNILEAVHLGVDFFDCVMPSRNARHGNVFSWKGKLNLMNEKYARDPRPIDEDCGCPACRRHSRSYIRHLIKAKEGFCILTPEHIVEDTVTGKTTKTYKYAVLLRDWYDWSTINIVTVDSLGEGDRLADAGIEGQTK